MEEVALMALPPNDENDSEHSSESCDDSDSQDRRTQARSRIIADIPAPKTVTFVLLDNESNHRAGLPLKVQIFPHDTTDSIVTTVQNYYGLYKGTASGFSFEDSRGKILIARYENFTNDMFVNVRVIFDDPQPYYSTGQESYHSGEVLGRSTTTTSRTLARNPWSHEDDARLMEAVKGHGMSYSQMAKELFPWTSPYDCRQRHQHLEKEIVAKTLPTQTNTRGRSPNATTAESLSGENDNGISYSIHPPQELSYDSSVSQRVGKASRNEKIHACEIHGCTKVRHFKYEYYSQ